MVVRVCVQLLAVSGPLQAWSPVVDGVVVREHPLSALRSGRFHKGPLMLGTSAEDGLISRAKNIKVRAGSIFIVTKNAFIHLHCTVKTLFAVLLSCI